MVFLMMSQVVTVWPMETNHKIMNIFGKNELKDNNIETWHQ